VAEHPQAPPGTPRALLAVIAVTALVSFGAMAWLWNTYVAALLLGAIAFHEAGHALAMRGLGYRDVHVFFIPLLGALTVGRPVAVSVRNRIAVLLAGPLPGLWLAVVVLVLDEVYGPIRQLRLSGLTLLLLNGLNLLPFTPLDGGRALEALGRPESAWRLVVHGMSAAGLLGLAAYTSDPVIAALGLFWIALLPRQLQSYRLRRAVAAAVTNRGDFREVVRTALEVMTTPPYARLRAATRQATARALGRVFADSLATSRDRAWGAIAYAMAWIPLIAGAWLWSSAD
jgi:Zn-dependent protease